MPSVGTVSLADAIAVTPECRVVTTAAEPWTIIHTSKAWSQLTGYRFLDVVGKSCSMLQGPNTEVSAKDMLHAAIKSRKPVKTQLVNYTKDGQPFRCEIECLPVQGGTHFVATIRGTPIMDGSVRPLKSPVTVTDPVVEPVSFVQRQAGKRPKRRLDDKLRLADALANNTDPLVLCAKDYPHVIMHPNQPWLEMCGYNLEEVEGLTNAILGGPETDPSAIERINACVRREEPCTETIINYKKGGVRFVNQVQVLPVYNENDELAAFLSMLHEVDESSLQAKDLEAAKAN